MKALGNKMYLPGMAKYSRLRTDVMIYHACRCAICHRILVAMYLDVGYISGQNVIGSLIAQHILNTLRFQILLYE